MDGSSAIFVQQAGVSTRPQKQLRHLHLPGDDCQVERRLQKQEVMQSVLSWDAVISRAES